jgi:hypothetical protein
MSDELLRRIEHVKLLLTEMVPDDATALPNDSFMYDFINENRQMVESFLAS